MDYLLKFLGFSTSAKFWKFELQKIKYWVGEDEKDGNCSLGPSLIFSQLLAAHWRQPQLPGFKVL